MTLADEDTNADYANRAIQRNIAMQVAPYGGKISNQWKWPQLVAKFACRTDVSKNLNMHVYMHVQIFSFDT